MGIQEKLEKAAELEALAAKLRAEVAEFGAKKWQPKGGAVAIHHDGEIYITNSHDDYRLYGTERTTREQAEKDAKRMRNFNRLLCWLIEQGWDDDMCVHADVDGHVSIVFYESEKFSRDLMYGIAHGVIEL